MNIPSMIRNRIEIIRGDITVQQADAIVNAANSSLLGGGGVDGAIHNAAGPDLLAECATLGGCPAGESRITEAYNLSARHVIHTVGPVWRGGHAQEPDKLASCYKSALALAAEHDCRVIAFPAISCGVFSYPLDLAAETSIKAVVEWVSEHDMPELVRWVMFDLQAYEAWESVVAAST